MAQGKGTPLVPFAGWGMRRLTPSRGPMRSAMRAVGDRFVHFAEDVLGEDLDARIARIPRQQNEVGFALRVLNMPWWVCQ